MCCLLGAVDMGKLGHIQRELRELRILDYVWRPWDWIVRFSRRLTKHPLGIFLGTKAADSQTMEHSRSSQLLTLLTAIYWSDGTFNVNEASANGSSVAPDVTGAPLTSPSSTAASGSSSSSSGAIIGGVVGALAVVGLAGFILCYMVRRRRRQAQDRSAFQSPIPQSHTSMIQTVTSPTGLTSNPSSHEFSNATPHPVFFSSITTTSLRSPITTDAADVITPFISPPTRPMPTSTKATEALVRRSESPQRRGRMNPPPYSPTAPAGSSSTPSPPPTKHPHRSKKLIRHVATGSVDTVATTTEADSAPPRMPPPTKPSHHPEARPQAVEMHSADSGSGSRGSDGRKTSEVEGVGFTRRYDGQKGTRASRNRPPAV
ncbi:hypothetical protein PISMIDRAFT_567412 [Pisolithus microcarpus 441]|uniref:Unplaced genomic scaffold scaffold_72, whole genome shotgun sequence n=1 Tax=Pisolithus microcarpus 441 TaxID=765257 RepID=A0A0C9YWA2_9AGAM|nr:hypothetical protein PISMIDRAFT_567412 [Pisolithus microcarpus 441]